MSVVAGSPRLFVVSLAVGIVPVILAQYSVRLLSHIISSLSGPTKTDGSVVGLVAFYAVVSLTALAMQYVNRVLTIRSNSAMLGKLQQRLHDKLLAMPSSYHDTHDFGETSTIVLQDAVACQPMLRDFIASPLTQGVSLCSALFFLWSSLRDLHNVPVGAEIVLLVALIVLPPISLGASGRLRVGYDAIRSAQGGLATEFTNSLSAPLEVQLLRATQQRARAFASSLAGLDALRNLAGLRSEGANQFQVAVPALLQLGFLTYAAISSARAGPGTAGAILAIYYFVPKVMDPIDHITRFFGGLQMIWVQATRMGEILDAPDPPVQGAAATLAGPAPEITFHSVDFAYPNASALVLRDFSHVFPAGRISAIVGRSGSGKSSLLGLIEGLREPQRGQVTIGPEPVRAGDHPLRDTIAVVSQSPLFISGTVRANFQLAQASATDAEIEDVARATGLWPALVKLGQGQPLDTMVPRLPGQGLSGGERRLLSVARILLRRPKVLLLDEPTTGVDTMSIGVLLQALRKNCVGMTVIMVEHNLDFVRTLADEVCCLQDGVFVDIGTPQELFSRPSLFRSMVHARESLRDTSDIVIASVVPPRIGGGTDADPWAGGSVPESQGGNRTKGELP